MFTLAAVSLRVSSAPPNRDYDTNREGNGRDHCADPEPWSNSPPQLDDPEEGGGACGQREDDYGTTQDDRPQAPVAEQLAHLLENDVAFEVHFTGRPRCPRRVQDRTATRGTRRNEVGAYRAS